MAGEPGQDAEFAERQPTPDPAPERTADKPSGALDAVTLSDEHDTAAAAPRRGAMASWLRRVAARLPMDSRPFSAPLDAFDALPLPVQPTDALGRAALAGNVILALAPGAPVGVTAPEGAPRVAEILGRDAELASALAALVDGASLAVHSDGLPGAGKTVFAVEAVSRAAESQRFPGGVVWISCESLSGDTGLAEVCTRVARALRVERALRELDPEARRATLAAALANPRRPHALVALATIEPTLDVAALLDTLAGEAITLLLTTRRALEDPRVTPFALAPLAADDATRLLRQRLWLRDRQRPFAEEDAFAAPLAEALGGAPLAIELTAAMAGVYGDSLDSLLAEAQVDGAKGAAAGLRARIDRLWRALTVEQQRTLAGLTLIEGATFPRALALALSRAALSDSEAEAEGADFGEAWRMRAAQHLDALTGLGAVEAMAAGRLRLHPLLRQQIAPRLSALDDDHTRQALGEAMARWWLEYARLHHGYEGMAGLESEASGLMGALTWAHAHGHWRLTLDLAEALGAVWRAHGRRDEALRIAQWAAEAADAEGDLHERHWARYQLAVAQSEAGLLPQARVGFAEALRLARELNDPALVRDGAHALAALAARTGEAELARASFSEALTLAREIDDPASVRDELHGLAILDAQANRLPEARAAYTEALSLARALGDDWATYLERYGLALVEMRAGETEQARAGFAEALALADRMDDRGARCDVLSSLGALDAQRGELSTARDGLLEAVAIARGVRDPRRGARALVWLAEVESASGDMALANEHFEQACALYEALGDSEAIGAMQRMRAFDGAS